jgi:surface polysaccharide O-acyltransferase-like enzyme
VDYELLRLIAIVGVVYNHTQYRGFQLYQVENCSKINYNGSILLDILCKIAVPLFFLISGGLLLHRQEDLKTLFRKRVLRIAVVLVLFSALLYVQWCWWGDVEKPSLHNLLYCLWSSGVSVPYWYLYAFLGLMLLLPFLRPMVQNMSDSAFRYLIALHILLYPVLATLGQLTGAGSLNSNLWLPMVEPNLFYFLLGYYLAHRLDWSRVGKRELAILWLLAAASVAIMYGLMRQAWSQGNGMNLHKSWIFFLVVAVYATVHQLCAWHPMSDRAAKWVTTLGSCTFGAYLLEGMMRHYLDPVYLALEPKIHVLPACLVWVAAVVISGLAITWVLKKLPIFRKLL